MTNEARREIKFRAWDKELGMSYFPVQISFSTGGYITGSAIFRSGMNVTLKVGNDLVFMQYTGLKDKNGKEIYSGDIIEDKRLHGILRFQVIDVPGGFAINTFQDELKKPYFYDPAVALGEMQNGSWVTSCEVIGNIYENSDLLKGI